MWEDQILSYIKRQKKDNEEDDTAEVSESISQTTPTIDEVDKCLSMLVFTLPLPSGEMMECMIRMSSIFFSKRTDKGKKNETM